LSLDTITNVETLNMGGFAGTMSIANHTAFTTISSVGAITLSGAGTVTASSAVLTYVLADGTNTWNASTTLALNALTGGSGADTFNFGLLSDNATHSFTTDAVAGGSGTDTINITGNIAFSQTLTNVSAVENIVFANTTTAVTATMVVGGSVTGGTTIDASSQVSGVATLSAAAVAARVNLIGGGAADSLTGGTLADTISGGAGVDTITGGTGVDALSGGSGADVYVTTVGVAYSTATADTISDFTVGVGGDVLQIDISDSTLIAGGIVAAGDGATAIAGNLVIRSMTAGTGITLLNTEEIVVISGTLANSTALLASIGTGAGIITKSTINTTTLKLLVVWNDGTSTYVSSVSDAGADAPMTTAQLAEVTLVTLTGVLTAFDTTNFIAVA